MLDKNALSQLQGLKDKIEAEKEIAEGTVKATRSRFGFVVLNDNREIFLPPDEMQRVLPGDRVSIVIKPAPAKDKSGKPQSTAEVETLLSTSVDHFVGEVVQKQSVFRCARCPRTHPFHPVAFYTAQCSLWRQGRRPRSVSTPKASVCRR
jgi:ribonuclease R